jgi:FkbM family methyltransferase
LEKRDAELEKSTTADANISHMSGQSHDWFLSRVNGVIHVGASVGQEKDVYALLGLHVLWIEPIFRVFAQLGHAIMRYPKQKACCALVTDVDGGRYPFNISNNGGMSSSILDLAEHRLIWPDVVYTEQIWLESITLTSLLNREEFRLEDYDALVLDTQGSELLVLKGAVSLLPSFKFILSEASDFECYKGCCHLADLDEFLAVHNFGRVATNAFAHKEGVGTCYNVLYARH